MNAVTHSNSLTIDGPGAYLTRGGLEVLIYEIKDNGATFNCHGYLLTPSKRERAKFKREWNIWSPDGRFTAVKDNKNDIIRRIS